MIRDSFYRQIVERLNGTLDASQFEDCAADLLRAIYPALVPMPGGSDTGMDGAVADGLGEPFPLVTTTSSDVIGNLTRNLRTYVDAGRTRRKVVLATSQSLTPKRVQNLFDRAAQLGFTLVQVHQQSDLAILLHRNPRWCRDLLNLTGNPPALSAVPLSTRALLNVPLVGRDTVLAWLRQTHDDRLLIGQPGSGKTFLLYQMVKEGEALFAVSSDRAEVAANLRSERPPIIIVDDAQNHRELLLSLKQMRTEIGAEFTIIASCWPGDKDAIAEIMNLTESRIRSLDLLTRPEIVQVINGAGVRGPNGLIREIVDQAEGRPGLAVTLAQLCLQGGVREVVLGDVLSRSLLQFFEPIVGHEASVILAAFAVGGDAGMTLQTVANTLGLSLVSVCNAVVRLAAGGVLTDLNGERLAVRPPALRHALVRDVFFRGAVSYPIEQFLTAHMDFEQFVFTLIGAKRRGAAIPNKQLSSLVEQTNSSKVWMAFAWLGSDESNWVLRHHPDNALTIAEPALFHAPESVVPLLLAASVGDHRQLHSTPTHPLRLIGDWVHEARPGMGVAVDRRRAVLEAVEIWLSTNGDVSVALQVLQPVFSPSYEYSTTDPGLGDQVTFTYGYITHEEMIHIQDFWPRALAIISRSSAAGWKSICEIVEAWAYPGRMNVNPPKRTVKLMRAFATRMLGDIVALARNHPGLLHWAWHLAKQARLYVPISVSTEFEVLYPQRTRVKNWTLADKREGAAVRELALRWSTLDPVEIAQRMAYIETEARDIDVGWPRWTPYLCAQIAVQIASPASWVRAMIDANCTADLIEPFLRRALDVGESDWSELARTCLSNPSLKSATISLILTSSNPPQDLLEQVLLNLQNTSGYLQVACAQRIIPEQIVARLLQHNDPTIARAAAAGLWLAEPHGTIPDSLQKDWQQVVVEHVISDFWLEEVFSSDPTLARRWLQARLKEDFQHRFGLGHDTAIQMAVNALGIEVRRILLSQIPDRYGFAEMIEILIDGHVEMYRELLSSEHLRRYHLVPLAGKPEGVWFDKALMALEAGYGADEVADATYMRHGMVESSGSETATWKEWVKRFDRLCTHYDARIRRIGEAGKARTVSAMERAAQRERREAIYGRSDDTL